MEGTVGGSDHLQQNTQDYNYHKINFNAADGWSGTTSSLAPSINVNPANETKVSTGIREALNKGSKLDVDHVGTNICY